MNSGTFDSQIFNGPSSSGLLGPTILYRIYTNDGMGGPVNYAVPIAIVSTLSYLVTPLAEPSNNTFLVRAYDSTTGWEDQNGDARVSVVIDVNGKDITGVPNAPWGLSLVGTANGGVRVAWMYNPGGQGGAPRVFNVYAGTPTPNYAVKLAEVAASRAPGQIYVANLSGFSDGMAYQVGVRAQNTIGEELNTITASFTAVVTGPSAVASLSATVIT